MRRAGVVGAIPALVLALVLTSCSSGAPASSGPDRSRPGPYPVGVTTLDLGSAGALGERMATVYYPADPAHLAGTPVFTYKLGDPLPASLIAFVPAKYNLTISLDAHVGPPGSPKGPFPVVLFSHGFGAARLYYSELLVGLASWGFVVVSADYLERGILAEATSSTVPDSPALDEATMLSSLDAAERASADPTSPLHGTVDARLVAAVGHSSGGTTAFDALRDPRVKTAVGWAPEGPSGTPSRKPVTIVGAGHDIGLTPAMLTREYQRARGPVTFVEISNEGHNTFTDLCPTIRDGGGGLIGYALSLHLITGDLAQLAVNGCTRTDIPAPRFWPIVQAYTIAAVRNGLGLDRRAPWQAVDGTRFPGFTVTVQHRG